MNRPSIDIKTLAAELQRPAWGAGNARVAVEARAPLGMAEEEVQWADDDENPFPIWLEGDSLAPPCQADFDVVAAYARDPCGPTATADSGCMPRA